MLASVRTLRGPRPAALKRGVRPVSISATQTFPNTPESTARPTEPAQLNSSNVNDLTVATYSTSDPLVTVSVHLKAGSRFDSVPGQAFLASRLCFKGTPLRSGLELNREFELIGSELKVTPGRNYITVSATAPVNNVSALVDLVTDAAQYPLGQNYEIDEELSGYVRRTYNSYIEQTSLEYFLDVAHRASFGNGGLGQALITPTSSTNLLNSIDSMGMWFKHRINSQNVCVTAVGGVSNEQVSESLRSAEGFSYLREADWQDATKDIDQPESNWEGGYERVISSHGGDALFGVSLRASGKTNVKGHLTDRVISQIIGRASFNPSHFGHPDIGFGKLHRQLADNTNNFQLASSHLAGHPDTGVLTVFARANVQTQTGRQYMREDETVPAGVHFLATFLQQLPGQITEADLNAAKNRVLVDLCDGFSDRARISSNLASQVFFDGGKIAALERQNILGQLQSVTLDDVKSSLQTMLASGPAVSGLGAVSKLPSGREFSALFKN